MQKKAGAVLQESKWVLMDPTHKCIVKGHARKYLVALEEPTRKQTVYYKTYTTAKNALRRSFILHSPYVLAQYGEVPRCQLTPVEISPDSAASDPLCGEPFCNPPIY